jgi:hypothetical protein
MIEVSAAAAFGTGLREQASGANRATTHARRVVALSYRGGVTGLVIVSALSNGWA